MSNQSHSKISPNLMKISQLSSASGVSKSSIHYYMNIGLLHKPVKIGLNTHFYDDSHLLCLNKIKELRKNQNLPLNKIKKIIECEPNLISNNASNLETNYSIVLKAKKAKKSKSKKY